MSFQNISNLDLGTFLQIIYSKGIFHQTSRDYSDWEMIKMIKTPINPGRQYDFQLSTSLAPASTQRRNPGQPNRAFPKGFRINHGEFTAKFKEISSTIEVDGQLLARASETAEKYADVWKTQAELAMDGTRRVMASEIYRDGTGALGHVGSSSAPAGIITISLKDSNRDSSDTANYGISYAGWFELDDVILPKSRLADVGGNEDASAMTGNGAVYLRVLATDEENNTVTFQCENNVHEPVDCTTAPAADEVLFRFDQQVFPAFNSGFSDFGDSSTTIVGLESLAANDGRQVHGMTLSGALAGTSINAGGASIDVNLIEKALNKGKRRTGKGRYDWKKMCTSYQTRSALVESKETDRRFVAVTDNTRGSAEFNYVHGESQLRLTTSEYIPEDAMWMLPEVKGSGDKVLEYVGEELKLAKYGNMPDFHFKNDGNGNRLDVIEQHMRGVNLLLCKHPAAILSINNFKNN
jgi:hypothetical protein